MSRIDATFAALRDRGATALIPYITVGDPHADGTAPIMLAMAAAGADIIELGIPFSDPMADGPSIQRAALRALTGGMGLTGVLGLVERFREFDSATPVVLMGYFNPLLSLGMQTFAKQAALAGVDGLIVVDVPPEEADPLANALEAEGLALIRLATPTTDAARLAIVTRRTSGFVYYVSVAGVTGAKAADAEAITPAVARVRAAGGLPVCVGFGIRTPDQAARIARIADGAVVGSALVDVIADSLSRGVDPVPWVLETASALAKAVSTARLGAA